MLLLAILAGCPAEKADDTATSDDLGADSGDSGEPEDTGEVEDTDTTIPYEDLCGFHFSERWAFNGQCPQMRTPCELTAVDESACSFSIAYASGMTMGMPYAMTVTGADVSFGDGDSVTGCVGTVVDGDTITGTCDGGCAFTLDRRLEE